MKHGESDYRLCGDSSIDRRSFQEVSGCTTCYGNKDRCNCGFLSSEPKEKMEWDLRDSSRKQHGGSHYLNLGIQPWDLFKANGTWDQYEFYMKATAIERLMRKKDGKLDVEKAIHTLQKLVEDWED